ncbi:MAG TPA: ATP-binding protein [Solirubrobacterales bacterium]|nr:ATP-binding protein [Solirubrobacterales bacterium]
MRHRLSEDARTYTVLRGLTLLGGVAALFLVPLRPEHQRHLAPLLGAFLLYKAASLVVLARWTARAREIFLGTVAADLVFVFLLVWFTGGAESHFYLLFYPLVALDAYHFGPGIGLAAAIAVSGLLGIANWLTPPLAPWAHLAARAALLALLALALGHVAARERVARARAEQLTEDVRAASGRLVQAEQLAAVGRLSARMAHEVRNPLGAIALNVDMLADLVRTCPGPAMGEAEDLLRGIREELQSLAVLTEEYRVAARLPRPRFEEDSLNDLVTEVVGFLRPLAERQGVRLAVDVDATLSTLAFDRDLLKQALRNLIKNSLEALPRGGRIGVRTKRDEDAAVIVVSDDGPGIAPEVAARLCEPFFTTKPRGTGLGLSIAREVAREHQGELTWRSQPGAGTEFSLRLGLREVAHG